MVKVVDRILYKLDDLVRPYVHKILVVIEPMLIDEDYYARVEGSFCSFPPELLFSSPALLPARSSFSRPALTPLT